MNNTGNGMRVGMRGTMSNGAWWVVRNFAVITASSAGGIWAVLHWVFDPSPNLWVVFGWAVSIGLVGVWMDAATLNATDRRVADESRVLRAGHRNRRPR